MREYKYIYFYPADVDYLREYFKVDISTDERTEVGNYILVPIPIMAGGMCYISERDFQHQGFEKSLNMK